MFFVRYFVHVVENKKVFLSILNQFSFTLRCNLDQNSSVFELMTCYDKASTTGFRVGLTRAVPTHRLSLLNQVPIIW